VTLFQAHYESQASRRPETLRRSPPPLLFPNIQNAPKDLLMTIVFYPEEMTTGLMFFMLINKGSASLLGELFYS
jgi:hypothetical protein